MKNFEKVIVILVTVFVVVFICAFVYVNADEQDTNILMPGQRNQALNTSSSLSAIIMQGNTQSPSDCQALKDSLVLVNHGYTNFSLKGWQDGQSNANEYRVTQSEFLQLKNYTIAYYSGHGAAVGSVNASGNIIKSSVRPMLNAIPLDDNGEEDEERNFGTSTPFNVAQALQVEGSNWRTDSYIKPTDNLRVLILAACYQLMYDDGDDTDLEVDDYDMVKYYARAMRASGIMAIAGYHGQAPSYGDDIIARKFIEIANTGSTGKSVWYSWEHANEYVYSNAPWAVLVYLENYNQYYRLPGFPRKEYQPPSADALIWMYSNELNSADLVSFTSTGLNGVNIEAMPLTISTEVTARKENKDIAARETAITTTSILECDDMVEEFMSSNYSIDDIDSMLCVKRYVSGAIVDTEEGVLEDSKIIVKRTYIYYDTFNGVKVLDSAVKVSVDAQGINSAEDDRKNIVLNISSDNMKTRVGNNYITAEKAQKTLLSEYSNLNIEGVSLAYVPAGDNTHVLCYEFIADHSFFYVEVSSGEIVEY